MEGSGTVLWDDTGCWRQVHRAVAAFDEKKCFSHAAFKESAGLPRAYCLEFVDPGASLGSTINTNIVFQKLITLKCLYHVRSHVLCQGNPEIHESQRMLVAIYSHSLFPDSTAWRRTVSLSIVKIISCLLAMQELSPPCRCSVTQSSGMRGIGHWVQQAARQRGTSWELVNRHGKMCGRQNSDWTLCAMTHARHNGKHRVLRRLKLVVGELHLSWMECALLPLLELRGRSTSRGHASVCQGAPLVY